MCQPIIRLQDQPLLRVLAALLLVLALDDRERLAGLLKAINTHGWMRTAVPAMSSLFMSEGNHAHSY